MLEFDKKYYSTGIENRKDLLTKIYILVDDLYAEYTPTEIQQRKGINRMKMSDSEIIAISIFGELCCIDSERALYSYCKKEFSDLFPNFCDRSRFNRIRRNLQGVIGLLFQKLTELKGDKEIQIVDSLPLPVCHFGRAHFHKTFRGYRATYGRCPSKKMTYFGYKIHLLCALDGFPEGFVLTSANVDDRKAVPELIDNTRVSTLLADKGYIGDDFQHMILSQYSVALLPLQKSNCHNYSKNFRKIIFKSRRRIETTISQFSDQLNLQKVRAKSLLGLIARLHSKFLAFAIAYFINISINFHNPISIKHLAF